MECLTGKGEIYKISSPCGKMYIGQTKCLAKRKDKMIYWGAEKRWKKHIRDSKDIKRPGCTKIHNSMNKYGHENFTVEVLLVCDLKHLDYYESLMIKEYDTLSPNGLNLTTGGQNGSKLSEESLEKLRIANIGKTLSKETREKISRAGTGRDVSDETREKIRIASIGRVVSEETQEKINNTVKINRIKETGSEYIYKENSGRGKISYIVKNKPGLKTKYFVSPIFSMEDKLKLAQEYLNC